MAKQSVLSPFEPPHRGAGVAPTSFAARLREETKLVHREAERTGFIAELIRGRATKAGYALFLANLVPVYAALETALEIALESSDLAGLLGAFAQPGLRRLPSLLDDLHAIGAPGGSDGALPEAKAYAAAIERAAAGDVARLVAHAYARYLGDLSGGQILKPILARSLGLAPDMLRFYDFPAIRDPEAAKAVMRDALDTIAPDSPAADAIVAEAVAAFRHNILVSSAVARAAVARGIEPGDRPPAASASVTSGGL